MAQCSEDELYQRADNLLRNACMHFQSIFLQKWENLTKTKWDGKNSVQELVAMLGYQFSSLIKSHQESQFRKGVVEEWDISLLSRLIYFNDNQNVAKDQAIRSITIVRNKLAHNARKKLNFKEYSSIESEVKSNLIILGMEEKTVQNIIDQAEATSLNSVLEQFNKLQAKGDNFFNKKSYEEAIEMYSNAIRLPNLPPGYLSVLHEKRSNCHLSKSKENINLKAAQLDLAFTDAEKAVKLTPDSWKGHHLLGLIYQERSKPDEALVHYRRAIAISPGQSEVKSDMDACTVMAGTFSREEHFDPHHMPMNLSERVKQYNDERNCNISEEDFLEKMKSKSKGPGQDHVITGEQYLRGWGVPQNYSEAAKHFAKARTFGNVEGIYRLAVLYREGLGVKRDISFAVELFKEAANSSEKNVFVLAAQHALGLLYEEGVGVPKDFVQAAYWYKKAADKKCGGAANNLAILYFWGRGVPLNEKMAEMYWKIGVEGKHMQSAYALHTYYLKRMEPELARSYFNLSIEFGNDRLKSSKAQTFERINKMENERAELEGDIKVFEKANELSIQGLTFYERMKREMSSRSPEMAKLVKDMGKLKVGQDRITIPQIWKQPIMVDINELLWKAEEGYKTAQSLLECMINNVRFVEMWSQRPHSDLVEIEELINILCLCLCTDAHIFILPDNLHSDVLQFLNELFQKFGDKKSKLDMQLRLCIFYIQSGFGGIDELYTELLVEAIRRYPDEILIYKALSCAYVHLKEFGKGLEISINGLLKEPNDPDLLLSKAAHFRLVGGKKGDEVREAYKQFIENAPKDHRMLPEAYYCIAYSYILEMETSKDKDEIYFYYGLGEEAEKVQLSCYLPCGSNAKVMVKDFMMKMNNDNSKKDDEVSIMQSAKSGLEEKMYLKDPMRIGIIRRHRKMAKRRRNDREYPYRMVTSVEPKLTHKISNFNELKSIKLQEMNPTKDDIYKGRFINVRVIEGPFFGHASIPLIVEDDYGEAILLCIYNVKQNAKARQTFGVGARFSVINPYMRMGTDGTKGIRVDDPKCLLYNEGVNNMCRYCGKEGVERKCSKCKIAMYCGRKCQEMDWKVLKHNRICYTG